MKKIFDVAVTFESTRQPVTWRGPIEGRSLAAVTRRAVAAAIRACPRQHWDSVVVLVSKQGLADPDALTPVAVAVPDPDAAR